MGIKSLLKKGKESYQMGLRAEVKARMKAEGEELPAAKEVISTPRYDENMRAAARTLWEITGKSAAEIGEKLDITAKTVYTWADKYDWADRKLIEKEVVPEITRSLLLEKLAEKGLPPERVMEALADGIIKPEEEITAIKAEDGSVELIGVVDYKTRHKYIETYLKFTGMVGGGGGQGNLTINNNEGGKILVENRIPALDELD